MFGDDFQRRAAGFLTDPGISVVEEARIAAGLVEVHAMHDVTEGGVATAVREMADAADLGAVLAEAEIPRFYESKRLMTHFGLDILGAIGSGALLIACAEPETGELLDRLKEAGNSRLRHRAFPPPFLRHAASAGIGAPGFAGLRCRRAHPAPLSSQTCEFSDPDGGVRRAFAT